jgi:ferric-dicitrate binding protein FerR (iron transport regulator)
MNSEIIQSDYEIMMVRYLSGEAAIEEQEQLLAWLKQDPERVKELNRLRASIQQCKAEPATPLFNVDKAFNAFEQTIAPKKTKKIRTLLLWSSSIAALLLLFFSINLLKPKAENKTILLGMAKEQKQSRALIDGTIVTLNAHSSLTSANNFTKNERKVVLKGEAFFDVKHDAQHPFTIQIDSVTVKVLGTAFNILPDTIHHTIVVTVQRGRVAVMYKNQSIVISAGEQATYRAQEDKLTKTKSNIENYNSWLTGQLVFNDTPLQEVVEALNKQYATDFEIGSNELQACKLNASFNYTDIKKVEELLSVVLKVDIKTENGKKVLYSRIKQQNGEKE